VSSVEKLSVCKHHDDGKASWTVTAC
jgi:hypothetical protein